VSEALRIELASIVEGELGDPRIAPVALTETHMSPDGKSVFALVQVAGDEATAQRSLEGLMSAKTYIRRELGLRLGLRKVPELIFELDKSQQFGARIDELLKRVGKRAR
jgi:ribosome-binding factor A